MNSSDCVFSLKGCLKYFKILGQAVLYFRNNLCVKKNWPQFDNKLLLSVFRIALYKYSDLCH